MGERDQVFLVELISLICNYAITYGYKPDDTLRAVAENILSLLEISKYNGWKGRK